MFAAIPASSRLLPPDTLWGEGGTVPRHFFLLRLELRSACPGLPGSAVKVWFCKNFPRVLSLASGHLGDMSAINETARSWRV